MNAGDCPDWYTDFAVAKRLGISVPEVETTPSVWVNRAICVINSEADAREYHSRDTS